MKRLLALPLITLLASCASHLSKEQCETISWKSEGYQDAIVGKQPRDLSGAIKDCAKFNLGVNSKQYMQGWKAGAKVYCAPDQNTGFIDGQKGLPLNAINYRVPVCNRAGIRLNLSDYKIGRNQGLKKFCTYENGVNLARQGKRMPKVCRGELRKGFQKGWKAGQREYCTQPANGFALGKANKPYPATCPANLFVAFKSEYDRGMAIGGQVRAGEDRISEINNYITSKRFRYGLEESVNGYYHLTRDKSPEAQQIVTEVNNLVQERKRIERDVFDLKTKG